jgi:hypothetical protein
MQRQLAFKGCAMKEPQIPPLAAERRGCSVGMTKLYAAELRRSVGMTK